MRTKRPLNSLNGLHWTQKLFIVLRPSSLLCPLLGKAVRSAYVLSFSSLLWDLQRTDSNDFLLDALGIHCVLWALRGEQKVKKIWDFYGRRGCGLWLLDLNELPASFLLSFLQKEVVSIKRTGTVHPFLPKIYHTVFYI